MTVYGDPAEDVDAPAHLLGSLSAALERTIVPRGQALRDVADVGTQGCHDGRTGRGGRRQEGRTCACCSCLGSSSLSPPHPASVVHSLTSQGPRMSVVSGHSRGGM